jgi:two-component system response regulator
MRKFTVLLIDDSPEDIELATRALRKNQFIENILHFKDGNIALDFLNKESAEKPEPKIILLDMNMPGMTGLEFIRKIKSDVKTKEIPIAVLTATTELPDIKESMRLGVKFYIPKPLESEDFDKIVEKIGMNAEAAEE